MLSDSNDILGAVINVLDYRLGTVANDPQPLPELPAEGYLITSGAPGDNFVDSAGNRFVWADRN